MSGYPTIQMSRTLALDFVRGGGPCQVRSQAAPAIVAEHRPPWDDGSLRVRRRYGSNREQRVSAAPRRASAGIALEAGAVPHEREVAAFAAGPPLVAFGLCLGPLFRRDRPRARARLRNFAARMGDLLLLELLGRRELLLGLGLERGSAFRARLAAGERRHLGAAGHAPRATLPAADRGG